MYCFSSNVIFVVLCTFCNAINDSVSINTTSDKKEVITSKDRNTKLTIGNAHSKPDISDELIKTVPWNTYINLLITLNIEQLDKIKSNIKEYYNLDDLQIESINHLFNNTEEYKLMISSNLKKLTKAQKFNDTVEFMLSFTNISNWVLEKIIKYNLDKVSSAFLSPTLWYKQTLKDKIQRQETKTATNKINSLICNTLNICREKLKYTDYLKEWLRHLLSIPYALKNVLAPVPGLLEKHKHIIKSNLKFRQTIKYILNADAVVQKDTLDFLDEVITNKNKVVDLVPAALSNSAKCLLNLFKLINKNYNIINNKVHLDSITNMIYDWVEGDNTDKIYFLDKMVDNMILNYKVWPRDAQRKVKNVWLDIIAL